MRKWKPDRAWRLCKCFQPEASNFSHEVNTKIKQRPSLAWFLQVSLEFLSCKIPSTNLAPFTHGAEGGRSPSVAPSVAHLSSVCGMSLWAEKERTKEDCSGRNAPIQTLVCCFFKRKWKKHYAKEMHLFLLFSFLIKCFLFIIMTGAPRAWSKKSQKTGRPNKLEK